MSSERLSKAPSKCPNSAAREHTSGQYLIWIIVGTGVNHTAIVSIMSQYI